jgi:hypothetical protein
VNLRDTDQGSQDGVKDGNRRKLESRRADDYGSFQLLHHPMVVFPATNSASLDSCHEQDDDRQQPVQSGADDILDHYRRPALKQRAGGITSGMNRWQWVLPRVVVDPGVNNRNSHQTQNQ